MGKEVEQGGGVGVGVGMDFRPCRMFWAVCLTLTEDRVTIHWGI